MNLNLPRKISAPVSLIEKKRKKRRQLLGGKCEVIYHGCGWRRGRRRGGGKESSPGTPPVAALILSRSRLGRDNKTFTAINRVSHSGLFLMPGLSGALQIQWDGAAGYTAACRPIPAELLQLSLTEMTLTSWPTFAGLLYLPDCWLCVLESC